MSNSLPTGFQNLDTFIGALQCSDLVILVVPPTQGQTSLVHSVALTAAISGQRNVALFSPNVNRYRIVHSLLAMTSGIDAHRLQSGQMSDEERRRVKEKASTLSMANLWIDDTFDLSPHFVRERLKQLAESHTIGLIIVDHIYLMRSSATPARDKEVWQEGYEVSRDLKAVTFDLQIPLIAVAPMSHALKIRRYRALPDTAVSTMRPSRSGTEHFLFLHRNQISPDHSTRSRVIIATVLITKQHDGIASEIAIVAQPDHNV